MKNKKNILALILAIISVFCLVSCGNTDAETPENETASAATDKTESSIWADALYTEDTQLGEGAKTVVVEVKAEEKAVAFTIKTDKNTVGEALSEHGLIEGEEGPYGLYVKKVNGILADYDVNQCYWAFNIDGETAMTGVDGAEITEGVTYQLEYAK